MQFNRLEGHRMKFSEYNDLLIENEKITFERIAIIKLICIFLGLIIPIPQSGFYFENASLKELAFDLFFKIAFMPTAIMQVYWSRTNTYKPIYKYWTVVIDIILLALYKSVPNFLMFDLTSEDFRNQALMLYDTQQFKWLWCVFLFSLFASSSYYAWVASLLIAILWILQYLFVEALYFFADHNNFNGFFANCLDNIVNQSNKKINANEMIDSVFVTFVMAIGFSFTTGYNRKTLETLFTIDLKRKMLSKYFSPKIVHEIEAGSIEGRRIETKVTSMFIDIRDYAIFAQNHKPNQVLDTLNEFHSLVETEVFKFNGTLEKYIGDAVFAVFGAPISKDDDILRSFECVKSIFKKVDDWNINRQKKGLEPLKIGIGLEYGSVICGVIGKDRNMNYAIVGNCVNRSSRLQDLCKELSAQVIMGSDFYEKLSPEIKDNEIINKIEKIKVDLSGFGKEEIYSLKF